MVTASREKAAPTLGALRERINAAYNQLQTYLSKGGNERLRARWPEWQERFKDLLAQSLKSPEVAISLVGGTGSGKSTLLNALVGARLLPVSNMRACTSAVCEVAYAEGPYRARVEFVPRATWKAEIDLLLQDLRDAREPFDGDNAEDPRPEMDRAVRAKLAAVYGTSEDGSPAQFDPFNLVEPPAIKQALDAGYTEIEEPELEQFRKQVAHYLDSRHRFWPIVRTVSIRGPFEGLADGARIVDLPGLNDPNEAREEVTRNHLKTCRYVWIVFNIKRALTRDMVELLQSEHFRRQIVLDGRADALTFVGTAADDLNAETAAEELGLDEDAEITEVVAARNRAVRKEVFGQLDDLAARLAQLAGEDKAAVAHLAAQLKKSQVFTVSAQEYLRLIGVGKTRAVVLETEDQTEVPALQQHLHAICANYGVTAHSQALRRQFGLLVAEINGEVKSQQEILKARAETSERQRKEMRAAAEAARTFLDGKLEQTSAHLTQDLKGCQDLLAERIRRAVDKAKGGAREALARWNQMHWGTLKAACRRGGVYVGPKGRTDLAEDLARPILDGIAFAWSDFFGEKLQQVVEKWTAALSQRAGEYRDRLKQDLRKWPDLPQNLVGSLDALIDASGKVLQEHLAQIASDMEGKIQHAQRTLYESVPDQVRANMQAAFKEAAGQQGSGMKGRMLDRLGEHARRVSQVMFDDAHKALLDGLRGLNDWLARAFGEMADAIRHKASLATEQITAGPGQTSDQAIEKERQTLDNLAGLVSNFLREQAA